MRSIWAFGGLALASLVLAGCGGGGSSAATASETAPVPVTDPGTPTPTPTPPPPAVTSGTATLSWAPPTVNSDGSTLTNLAGYRIYYGTSTAAMTQTVQIASPGTINYVLTSLTSGTWYFAVRAYTNAGVESSLSNVASKTI